MRILFVAPWAPTGTRTRAAALLDLLSEEHEVTVLATTWSKVESQSLRDLRFDAIDVPSKPIGAAFRAIRALFGRRSLQQAWVSSGKFKRALQLAVAEMQPDLVYFNVLRGSAYAHMVNTASVIVDLDDIRSDYYAAMASESRHLLKRVLGRIEAKRMRLEETRLDAVADAVLVSSPVDDNTALGGNRYVVRTPTGSPSVEDTVSTVADGPIAVLVGRMNYGANVEAALWLRDNVLPILRESEPRVPIAVVGADPTPALVRSDSPDFIVTGRVADLDPYLHNCIACLVPVRMASGVQLKLLDGARVGAPIVATAVSARQAGMTDGKHCVVAESPEDWARAIINLARDDASRRRLGEAARRWWLESYSVPAVRDALSAVVNEVTSAVGRCDNR